MGCELLRARKTLRDHTFCEYAYTMKISSLRQTRANKSTAASVTWSRNLLGNLVLAQVNSDFT